MSVVVIVVLGMYLLCWQGYKLRGRLSGFGHVALILTLVGILAVAGLARAEQSGVFGTLDPRYLELLASGLVIVPCVSLYLFRLASDGYRAGSAAVVGAVALAVAVAAAMTVLTVVTVGRGDPLSYAIPTFVHPAGAAFFLLTGAYYGVVLLLVGVWMLRSSRARARTVHTRVGVRVAAVGIFAMSALSLGRAAPVAVVALGGPAVIAPPVLLGLISAVAAPFVFGGLSYPLLAGWIVGRRADRRVYLGLGPLWNASTTAYPQVVAGATAPRAPRSRWRRLPIAFKLQSRQSECFGGLQQLRTRGAVELTGPARGAAEVLLAAVGHYERAHAEREPVWDALTRSAPAAPGADTELLLGLSDAVRTVSGERTDSTHTDRTTAAPLHGAPPPAGQGES